MKKYKLLWIIFLGLLAVASPVNAQNISVSGKVTDESGEPLPGVYVVIKSSPSTGTITGTDGRYLLKNVPSDAVLSFSSIGYLLEEVPVDSRTQIDVQLAEEITALSEITVNAGYYSVKDRERTGSIVKVTAREIENQPANNPLEALQGKITGVDIVQNSGAPGGGFEVKIRGENSIAAGNESLYIIDGVPYDIGTLGNQYISGTILPGGVINPLNTLDPSSIESIEILKDADATAIYGSRGANGVVLITTKKGKAGKTSFKIEASGTMISVTRMPDLLNTQEYLNMRREAFTHDGFSEYPEYAYDINGTWDQQRYTDWQKELLGSSAYNNTVSASISGGNEQTRFTAGGTWMKETTVFPMDFIYRKTTVFVNISHNSENKRFNLQFSTNYGKDRNFLPTSDLSRIALILPPNAPALYAADGSLNWENSTWTNPLAALKSTYRNQTNNLMANTVLSYKLWKGLELKTNLGYNRSDLNEIQINPHTMYNPAYGLTSASSNALKNDSKRDSWIVEPQMDANYELGSGKLNVTIGSTFQQQNREQIALLASGFANDYLITNFSAANSLQFLNEEATQYRYQAVYARLNYIWKEKYIVNLTGRRDGSSRFGPGKRFANFGAIGAAWIFSKEKFSENLYWLSFGKLRASFGTTGNDQIGDYQYLNTYSITGGNYNGYIGLNPSRLYNPYYAWEKSRKIEGALEAGFWESRLAIEIAYYNNQSDNQLIGTPLPGTTGFSSINANLNATVENSGWEISLRSLPVQRTNFQWTFSINLTIPKNRLKAFPGLEGSTYASQLVIGKPLSIYKLYQLKGVNPETGLFEFEDFNNDGSITGTADRQFIADFTPRYYGSISNSLRYKNWNLDFLFQYVKKKGLNEFYNTEPPGIMFNQPASVLDHWQESGDQAAMQVYTTGWDYDAYEAYSRYAVSSGVVSDMSFIRLKSLYLSYKFPFEKSGFQNWVLYVQGQNLLTFTQYKGGDPEQLTGFLPPMRRISLGLKIEL